MLICDGQMVRRVLARDYLTEEEALSDMRPVGIARLEDVAWGILEPDGKISVLQKGS